MTRLVVEAHRLFRLQCNLRVHFAIIVAELDLVNGRSPVLNNRANLAADEFFLSQVLDQSHHRKYFKVCHHKPSSFLTRRSRNQTGRDKSKSWTLSQSASNGPWVLNEKRYPKSFLPGNVMIPLDRY